MLMKTRGPLLFAQLMILASCEFFGDRVDKEKLAGRYVFQIDKEDTLDIYANGTYSYYRWWNGRKLQNSGAWVYNPGMGEVSFKNFSFLTDSLSLGDSTFLSKGNWITRIRRENEEIRFVYASDVYNGYFLKVGAVAE